LREARPQGRDSQQHGGRGKPLFADEWTGFWDAAEEIGIPIHVHLSVGGVCRYHLWVQFEKKREGEAKNVILCAFGAHYDIKQVVVVDTDVDVHDPAEIEWAIATRFQADRDLVVIEGAQGSPLDPSTTVGQAIGHGARRFLPTVGALLILFACLAIVVIPLIFVLIYAGVLAVPVQGQPPPPSFTMFALFLALASLAFSVKFMMAVPISTAEQVGPLDTLKRSWRLTGGNYWRLLAFLALLLVAAVFLLAAAQFVGGIAAQLLAGRITPFSLGALILALLQALASATATTLFAVMLARIYLQLVGGPAPQASVPSSGT